MLKTAIKKSQQIQTRAYTTNPINTISRDEEVLSRIENSVIGFMNFFEDPKVDNVIKKEFGKDYPELSLVVKEYLISSGF